jgi:hypothetical protein
MNFRDICNIVGHVLIRYRGHFYILSLLAPSVNTPMGQFLPRAITNLVFQLETIGRIGVSVDAAQVIGKSFQEYFRNYIMNREKPAIFSKNREILQGKITKELRNRALGGRNRSLGVKTSSSRTSLPTVKLHAVDALCIGEFLLTVIEHTQTIESQGIPPTYRFHVHNRVSPDVVNFTMPITVRNLAGEYEQTFFNSEIIGLQENPELELIEVFDLPQENLIQMAQDMNENPEMALPSTSEQLEELQAILVERYIIGLKDLPGYWHNQRFDRGDRDGAGGFGSSIPIRFVEINDVEECVRLINDESPKTENFLISNHLSKNLIEIKTPFGKFEFSKDLASKLSPEARAFLSQTREEVQPINTIKTKNENKRIQAITEATVEPSISLTPSQEFQPMNNVKTKNTNKRVETITGVEVAPPISTTPAVYSRDVMWLSGLVTLSIGIGLYINSFFTKNTKN